MSVSLEADIQQEGESGPLNEPCSKASPQLQDTKEGTGEGQEPEDGSLHDAQVLHSTHFTARFPLYPTVYFRPYGKTWL